MKQFVIDELRPQDFEKIKKYLDENFEDSQINQLYWIRLDDTVLTSVQRDHKDCYPFYIAADLESDRINFELLVRTKNRMRCNCMAYTTDAQLNWLVKFVDTLFCKLEIKT